MQITERLFCCRLHILIPSREGVSNIALTIKWRRYASHSSFFAVRIEMFLREARRFVTYGVVGVLGTATDVAVAPVRTGILWVQGRRSVGWDANVRADMCCTVVILFRSRCQRRSVG